MTSEEPSDKDAEQDKPTKVETSVLNNKSSAVIQCQRKGEMFEASWIDFSAFIM